MAQDVPEGSFFFRKTKIRATTTGIASREAADAKAGIKNFFFCFSGLHKLVLHKSGFPSSLQSTCDILKMLRNTQWKMLNYVLSSDRVFLGFVVSVQELPFLPHFYIISK